MKIYFVILFLLLVNISYATNSKLDYEIKISLPDSNETIGLLSSHEKCILQLANKKEQKLLNSICQKMTGDFDSVLRNDLSKQMIDRSARNADLRILREGVVFQSVVSLNQQTTCDLNGRCSVPKMTEQQKLVFYILKLAKLM